MAGLGAVLVAVITLITCVAAIFVPIRISLKAKPLGWLPYRWGLYLGIMSAVGGCIGLWFAFSAFFYGTLSEAYARLLEVLAGVAGLGLCRRKRWGVVVWFMSTSLEILSQFIKGGYQGVSGPQAPELSVVAGFAGLLFLLVNVAYFRKRWQLMASEPVAGSPTSSQAERKPRKGIIYTEPELESMREQPPQR
jgi:hypothetical protein